MRYKIKFAYDGTLFHGYQKQDGYRSVEECFEKALYDINNHIETKIYSSGRTDRGVHAKGQVAHFDLSIDITLYKLKCALNSLLPEDIHVIDVESVPDDFHARFNAKKKRYVYYLNVGEYDPLKRNYIYQFNHELDVAKMQEAMKDFLGIHDFKNFVSDECLKEDYVRDIYDARIERDKDIIKFTFVGNGFMKYQVRNMVGTLIKIGQNKIEKDSIKKIFEDAFYKKLVMTAKAEGLYLEEVTY